MEEDASFDGGREFVGGDLTGNIKWCWYNMLRRHNLTAIFCFSSTIANRENLTVELIHRDSPHSPLYNPHHTVSDGLNAAFLRSISRSRRFNTKTDLQSGLISNGGEYFMSISIGTPPSKVLAIADTGSDLTWVQCKPCQQCYKQNSPLFDKKKSKGNEGEKP
ncbi:Xylanase inhibitor N-terminal [Arabidopsis suecica]|uniref:Xylanase inhibitor N-terminal n=1 Tax=Arabidopsis suecica TaxID=45249 RepID=A0A8T1ZVP7_ARASU|nr:Xylanase inhibitor N-terminal [Arabidopsis suecica]